MDRGYAKFELFNRIVDAGSSYVCRIRDNKVQVYCAIIACMLISLWTGGKPTLRTHEMICWYFCGMASEEELLAHLSKLKALDDRKKSIV